MAEESSRRDVESRLTQETARLDETQKRNVDLHGQLKRSEAMIIVQLRRSKPEAPVYLCRITRPRRLLGALRDGQVLRGLDLELVAASPVVRLDAADSEPVERLRECEVRPQELCVDALCCRLERVLSVVL